MSSQNQIPPDHQKPHESLVHCPFWEEYRAGWLACLMGLGCKTWMFLSVKTFVNGKLCSAQRLPECGWEKGICFEEKVFLRDRTRSLISVRCKSKTTVEKIDDDHQGVRTKEENGFLLHFIATNPRDSQNGRCTLIKVYSIYWSHKCELQAVLTKKTAKGKISFSNRNI